MQTMKSDNLELAALATSALVNLCNYSPDIKQIFFTKNGLDLILEYLETKKELILMNVLRLIQVFIANSEQFTKKIAEERDQAAVKSLLKILNGRGVGGLEYDIRIYQSVIVILRQFIRFFAQAKDTIINSQSLQTIVNKLKPENVRRTPELFEIKIYQFLIQLVKEDMNKKYIVGQKMFKDVYQQRLRFITSENTNADQAIVLYSNSTGNPGELERNFFKLLHFLSKNCPKNNEGIKSIK